ncbi:unnamed protein product [Heterobilharzia americana]|nr:unnamed protein product [Heterobilharzia americana]
MEPTEAGDEIDWDTIHDWTYRLLCSIHSAQEIKKSIEILFEKFIQSNSEVSVYTCFQKECFTFMDLSASRRYSVMQFVLLLDLDFICERILALLSSNNLKLINWSHILQLISVMICVKGGVSTIKFIIRQLLLSLFNPSMKLDSPETEKLELNYIHLLDDVFNEDENEGDNNNNNNNNNNNKDAKEQDKQILTAALLFARQLCCEDSRLTGINYSQWWSETFCTPLQFSLTNTTLLDNNYSLYCILSSRSTVFYFCDLLIELLPFETDAKFLQIQLNTKLNWFNNVKKLTNSNRMRTNVGRGEYHQLRNTGLSLPHIVDDDVDQILMPIDLDPINTTDDIDYVEACMNRWNDYCDIARGRLAELREHCSSTRIVLTDKKTSVCLRDSPTPGWNDILSWLHEILAQRSVVDKDVNQVSSCRLPSEWNEVNLFRPRWLRCTLIPALIHAPEIEDLSRELKDAREQLLHAIRTAGLSHLLDNSQDISKFDTMKQITSKKRFNVSTNNSSLCKQPKVSSNKLSSNKRLKCHGNRQTVNRLVKKKGQ